MHVDVVGIHGSNYPHFVWTNRLPSPAKTLTGSHARSWRYSRPEVQINQ
jgi:hypothetical protein